jgi:hypothetical protein
MLILYEKLCIHTSYGQVYEIIIYRILLSLRVGQVETMTISDGAC